MKSSRLTERIAASVSDFPKKRILVLGDLMLDHYLMGDVQRISPEGPVPVVRVRQEAHTLGGAGNVVKNLAALGVRPTLVSVCGDDDPGYTVVRLAEREGLESIIVRDKKRPTTIKTRIIAQNQQVVRVDRETDQPVSPRVRSAVIEALERVLPGHDGVIVSDYAKGLVSRPVLEALLRGAGNMSPRPPVLVDPKVPNRDIYQGVDLLTPNVKEAGEMTGFHIDGKTGIIRAGLAIFKKTRCRALVITLGADGIALFSSPGHVRHIPTMARKVFDVTGAGDTVIAALAAGLTAGLELLDACVLANYCAGIVVGQVGSATVSQKELLDGIGRLQEPHVETWLQAETA
jgi:rfaE bifunctional protein kinase chain/domain